MGIATNASNTNPNGQLNDHNRRLSGHGDRLLRRRSFLLVKGRRPRKECFLRRFHSITTGNKGDSMILLLRWQACRLKLVLTVLVDVCR